MSSLRTLALATRAPVWLSHSRVAVSAGSAATTTTTRPTTTTHASSARKHFLHSSASPRAPYKDDQDRESLKPRSSEFTRSGTDGEAANNPDAAFNPDKTSPEDAQATASKGNEGNPLEMSGANKDVAEAGRGKEEDRPHGGQTKASQGGSAEKKGKVE